MSADLKCQVGDSEPRSETPTPNVSAQNPTSSQSMSPVVPLELGSDELLILHAAGELSAADARALDARLATDAALKARFDELRSDDAALTALLAAPAAYDESAASEWAKRRAVERFSLAIRDSSTAAASQPPARLGWRINRYALAGAVAAAVVLGLAVWISMSDIGTKLTGDGQIASNGTSGNEDPGSGTNETGSPEEYASAFAVVNAFGTFDEPTLDDDSAQTNRNLQYILLDNTNEVAANGALNTVTN